MWSCHLQFCGKPLLPQPAAGTGDRKRQHKGEMAMFKEFPDDNRILFAWSTEKHRLVISVPKCLATEEFRGEARTAEFIEVSLCEAHGGNNVRITFDDGSPTPFMIFASVDDFRQPVAGELRLWLPVRGSLQTASVIVRDPDVMQVLESEGMSREAARRVLDAKSAEDLFIWRGRAKSTIELEEGRYRDGNIFVEGF
jgi:hypothetical protein